MVSSLVYFGGKPSADRSMTGSQFSAQVSTNNVGPLKETEPAHSYRKSLMMTNGWSFSRSFHQDFRVHSVTGSPHDGSVHSNKIASTLLGGRLHTSKGLLGKPNPKVGTFLKGHDHCTDVQVIPLSYRGVRPPISSNRKKVHFQENRAMEGLADIFGHLTGQDSRNKLTAMEDPDQETSTPSQQQVNAQQFTVNDIAE